MNQSPNDPCPKADNRTMKTLLFLLTAFWIFIHPTPAASQSPKANENAAKKRPAEKDADEPSAKPFADLTKNAQAIKGLFNFYRKHDKVYLEILPEQFDRNFLCSPTLESGIGERGLLSAQVLDEFVFSFHRQGTNVQFLKKNVRYRADDHTPIQRAVARSFTDSILAFTKIESQPHPTRKSVLVDLK